MAKSHEKSQHISSVRAVPTKNGWIVAVMFDRDLMPEELFIYSKASDAVLKIEATMTEIEEYRKGE